MILKVCASSLEKSWSAVFIMNIIKKSKSDHAGHSSLTPSLSSFWPFFLPFCPSFPLSFLPFSFLPSVHSFLPSLFLTSFLISFLPSFLIPVLSSLLPSFLPFFLPPFLPYLFPPFPSSFFVPSFLFSFLPSFLISFLNNDTKCYISWS